MSLFFAAPGTGLWPALFGTETPHVAALVGAGGKTTAVKTLGAELAQAGRRVIITTTTKMHPPEDGSLLASSAAEAAAMLAEKSPVWAGLYYNEYKIEGIPGALPALAAMADCVLVEADGARKRPLKMTDPRYEPAVPAEAEAVVAVAGLDGVGKPLEEAVHRPELFRAATGYDPAHIITPEDAARLLRLCYAPRLVLLNKADGPEAIAAAEAVAAALPEARCVAASLRAWGLAETR